MAYTWNDLKEADWNALVEDDWHAIVPDSSAGQTGIRNKGIHIP